MNREGTIKELVKWSYRTEADIELLTSDELIRLDAVDTNSCEDDEDVKTAISSEYDAIIEERNRYDR